MLSLQEVSPIPSLYFSFLICDKAISVPLGENVLVYLSIKSIY